ncbi:MFS transporter [Halobacillus litoralis]|uniref:MFS transporter n=1 Tax=Halobacillus litoralis TaxID=45668 RepID=UPI001CD216FB|nr:MFS transporter [Halobacillus litoralis]MCA0970205.1 MFS transporter [Halobacillus litoralis]
MEALENEPFKAHDERKAFRLLGSNFISFFGDQIYMITLPLIILGLTGSPLQMGIVSALERLPVLLQPYAGVLADRANRKILLLSCDAGRFAIMGGLGVLAVTQSLQLIHLYLGALLIGCLTQCYQTAQFATLPRLVHKSRLQLFNSINTGLLQFSIVIGPAVGGLVISLFAPGVGLILNSLTFLAAFFLMWALPNKAPSTEERPTIWNEVKEGAQFIIDHKPILFTNLAMFFSIFGTTLFLTMMIVHVRFLSFSAVEIGWFASFGGLGALLGAAGVNVVKPMMSARTLLFSGGTIGALSIIAFSVVESFWMLSLMNAIGAFTASMMSPAIVTIRQYLTPDRLLGRVQATSRWMTWLLMPVAALVSGILAEWIGTGATIAIGGVVAFAASFLYLHPSLKQV